MSIEAVKKLQLKKEKTPYALQIEVAESRSQGNHGWILSCFIFYR
jgi:hypothetical protein